jgi:hypothetical protein
MKSEVRARLAGEQRIKQVRNGVIEKFASPDGQILETRFPSQWHQADYESALIIRPQLLVTVPHLDCHFEVLSSVQKLDLPA